MRKNNDYLPEIFEKAAVEFDLPVKTVERAYNEY